MTTADAINWNLPDWLAAVFATFEADPSAFSESQVFDSINAANPERGSPNSVPLGAVRSEIAAFAVHHKRGDHDAAWPTHFQPLALWQAEDGRTRATPDMKSGGADRLDYWRRRLESSAHPVLRARYADLRWDFAQYVGGQRRERADADAAIEGYLAASKLNDPGRLTDSDARMGRALELSMLLGDMTRQEQVVIAYIDFVERHRKPGKVGTWCGLWDDLLLAKRRPPLTDEQIARIVTIGEDELSRALPDDAESPVNVWAAEAAATKLAAHYGRSGLRDQQRRVLGRLGVVFEIHAGRSEPLVAVHFLDRAKSAYQEAGMGSEAIRVQNESLRQGRLAECHSVPIEASVEIKKDDREQYLEAMTDGGLSASMLRFADRFVQRREQTLDQIRELESEFISHRILPRSIMSHGNIVAIVGNLDNDPEGRLIHGTAEGLQLRILFMSWVIDRIRQRYSPSADDLWAELSASPVYVPERQKLITEGIRAYLEADYTKSIHVLLPQIEHALLVLLKSMPGKTINKPFRDRARGVMQFKNLSDILADEDVAGVLGVDLHLHLIATLAHPKGLNLRNLVCHGLCSEQATRRPWADVTFHCLFALSLLRVRVDSEHTED